jgi:hypothetical protein
MEELAKYLDLYLIQTSIMGCSIYHGDDKILPLDKGLA